MSKEYRIPKNIKPQVLVRGIINASYWHWNTIDEIQHTEAIKYLNNLEQIDNAKPNEALNGLEFICKILNEKRIDIKWLFKEQYNTIKQALIKAQEQEKVLEIIKGKRVNILLFLDSLLYSGLEYYNSHMAFIYLKLTQDEFELLKRWIGNGNQ